MKLTELIARPSRVKIFAGVATLLMTGAVPAQSNAAALGSHHRSAHAALLHSRSNRSATLAGSRQATPPDSYLQYKVYTVPQLVNQVSASPKLIHYYARTWHKSDAYVVKYISQNVQESYIPETAYYTVYCVRPNGLVYPTRQKMAKGTRVFSLSNGTPIMKWLCGNPITQFLPAVRTATVIHTLPSVQYLVPVAPVSDVMPIEQVTPVYTATFPVIAAPSASTQGLLAPTHHLSPAAFLPLALVALIPTHGHNGSTPIPVAPSPPSTIPVTTPTPAPISPSAPSTVPTTTTTPTPTPVTPLPPGTVTSGSVPISPTAPPTIPSAPSVPELGSGSTVAIGLIPIGILALMASMRKNARNG